MTDLFWASVIVAPVAMGLFIPTATYLYLAWTSRSLRPNWLRNVTGLRSGRVQGTRGDTVIAVLLLALSQSLVTGLIIDSFGDDPFAMLALACGVAEWSLAVGWIVVLITASSLDDDAIT